MDAALGGIVREFESASARLERLRQRLTAEAWARRPAPEAWSPAECVAHLNLTSAAFAPVLRQGLEQARRVSAAGGRRYRLDMAGWLVWHAVNPFGRFKVKTAAAFVPSGDRPVDELLDEFAEHQAAQIALTRAAEGLPIDRVKIVSPFDARLRYSVFSALSILPRHQHRHLGQAERAAGVAGG